MKKLVVAAALAAVGLAFATSGEEATAYAAGGKDPNDEYGQCAGKPKAKCWRDEKPLCDCLPGAGCKWACMTTAEFTCGTTRPYCDDQFTKPANCECDPSVGCWWACPKPPPSPPVYKTCREAPSVKCFAGLHPSCSCSEKAGCSWECPL